MSVLSSNLIISPHALHLYRPFPGFSPVVYIINQFIKIKTRFHHKGLKTYPIIYCSLFAYLQLYLSVTNSLIWNNEGGNFSCDDTWLGVNVTINNNMDSCDAYANLIMNPLFVSPSLEDFSVDMESPCIDAGDNNYVTSETDFIHNFSACSG
ncbi:MAG: hypothetical protein P9M03_08155 [Candidatus Theseobacter exili]|nr:hypothetical protein [Candidatus Theseobacter exili]